MRLVMHGLALLSVRCRSLTCALLRFRLAIIPIIRFFNALFVCHRALLDTSFHCLCAQLCVACEFVRQNGAISCLVNYTFGIMLTRYLQSLPTTATAATVR